MDNVIPRQHLILHTYAFGLALALAVISVYMGQRYAWQRSFTAEFADTWSLLSFIGLQGVCYWALAIVRGAVRR